MQHHKAIQCPTCGKQHIWDSNNKARPFCSDRCKLIDLGEWASETRTIPGEPVDPNFVVNNTDDLY